MKMSENYRMKKILVLGASGMLGSAVAKELQYAKFKVLLSARNKDNLSALFDPNPNLQIIEFDVEKHNLLDKIPSDWIPDFIINCIGVTKSHIKLDDIQTKLSAIQVNTVFSNQLAQISERIGARIIQISTDCVYSGKSGNYFENDVHDAEDVYGKTKSLGEASSKNVMNIRCSTVGPELGRNTLLLEWLRSQPINAHVRGFSDHIWNGVTTQAFAKVARGVIKKNKFKPGLHHLVPRDKVDKDQLLRMIAEVYGRDDIKIERVKSEQPIDRSLQTLDNSFNEALWESAGYTGVPRIFDLLQDLVE